MTHKSELFPYANTRTNNKEGVRQGGWRWARGGGLGDSMDGCGITKANVCPCSCPFPSAAASGLRSISRHLCTTSPPRGKGVMAGSSGSSSNESKESSQKTMEEREKRWTGPVPFLDRRGRGHRNVGTFPWDCSPVLCMTTRNAKKREIVTT